MILSYLKKDSLLDSLQTPEYKEIIKELLINTKLYFLETRPQKLDDTIKTDNLLIIIS